MRVNKHIAAIFFVLMTLPSFAQSAFSESLQQEYRKAVALNEEGRYADAYRMLFSADRRLAEEMMTMSASYFQLSAWDREFYLALRISMAETAYMMGISSVMENVVEELEGLSVGDEAVDYLRARVAKLNAGIHYLKKEYGKAEDELMKALKLWIYDRVFTQKLMIELAQLYYAQKRYEDALKTLDDLVSQMKNQRGYSDLQLDYNELQSHRAICLARLGRFTEANAIQDSVYTADNPEWKRRKAKILMLEYVESSRYNPLAKQLYGEYLANARKYVDENFIRMTSAEREQYWQSEKSFVTDSYLLEDKAPELLYDIVLFSKAVLLQMGHLFKADMTELQKSYLLSGIRVRWKDVQKKMPEKSTAVEFVIYEKDDTARVGALVLNKGMSRPEFVKIAAVSEISSLYFVKGRCSTRLPSLIWNEQLLKLISGSDAVYFAADGFLHQLPVEYIIPEEMEGIEICRLSSTRLLTESRQPSSDGSLLVAGGVEYDSGNGGESSFTNDLRAYSVFADRGLGLKYLQESRREVIAIDTIRNDSRDSLLLGSAVTEEAVRRLMGQYNIVHIATHGYFPAEDNLGTDMKPMLSDVQLSNNCIFLAAAESNINNESFDPSGLDGILSARELSGMDLNNVSLAVLSACRSGLGYVTEDGVYGLQRGLKSAGVGAIIVSLWDVDDMATSVFFQKFYHNLHTGMTIHRAFKDAREYLMNATVTVKRRRTGLRDITSEMRFNEEKFYNAFILIDALK